MLLCAPVQGQDWQRQSPTPFPPNLTFPRSSWEASSASAPPMAGSSASHEMVETYENSSSRTPDSLMVPLSSMSSTPGSLAVRTRDAPPTAGRRGRRSPPSSARPLPERPSSPRRTAGRTGTASYPGSPTTAARPGPGRWTPEAASSEPGSSPRPISHSGSGYLTSASIAALTVVRTGRKWYPPPWRPQPSSRSLARPSSLSREARRFFDRPTMARTGPTSDQRSRLSRGTHRGLPKSATPRRSSGSRPWAPSTTLSMLRPTPAPHEPPPSFARSPARRSIPSAVRASSCSPRLRRSCLCPWAIRST